jgi:hypothetical protein
MTISSLRPVVCGKVRVCGKFCLFCFSLHNLLDKSELVKKRVVVTRILPRTNKVLLEQNTYLLTYRKKIK